MVEYKRFRQRGFSLMELMVVMVIIGLMLGLVTANLDSLTPSSRLIAGARAIASTLNLAYNRAIVMGREVIVRYDINKGTYQVILPAMVPDGPPNPLTAWTLPSGVSYEDIVVYGEGKKTREWVEVYISPTGIVRGHVVHLRNRQNLQMTVEVNPIGGAVSVLEGYQPLQFLEKP